MRCLTLRNLVGLAAGLTAAAGVLVLIMMQPPDLSWVPTLSVVAASVLLAAAAGAHHLVERRRTRNSRRIIANLRAVGAEMEADGYFQTDQERRLLADAYDVPKETKC